jgi:hypothetical protein
MVVAGLVAAVVVLVAHALEEVVRRRRRPAAGPSSSYRLPEREVPDLIEAGRALAGMCARLGVDVDDVMSIAVRPAVRRPGEADITITTDRPAGAPYQRGFTVPVLPARSAS